MAWSLLVSCLGMKEGCAHCDNITRNNKQRHRHRLSFGSHVAHSDVALETWHCHVVVAVVVVGDRCVWQRLVVGMVR